MASWTDNPIENFNPYVQQLPLEAYVSVGMQKQMQYNQGIERIQSQIDTIAGWDIARDVDKQYLQSRLNQLGGDLKKVAAGDFSNFQLQNSVGGMINKIGKDKNIQNAVGSTIVYRKGLTDMESARKEGKSSPSNEWDFMDQANKWLQNPEVGGVFNGSFNQATPWRKDAVEVIKAITKSKTLTEEGVRIDANGNVEILDATVRKELAGITPEQIKGALMVALTPAAFKQMEIDGRYSYANTPAAQLIQDNNSSYTNKISFYNRQKQSLESAKSSTKSTIEKERLDEQIATIDRAIQGVNKEHSVMSDLLRSGRIEDLDRAKAHLYTINAIEGFAKAFSYTETSQAYVGKTPQEMNMWRAEQERMWKQFRERMDFDKSKFALEYEQRERLGAKKDKGGDLGGVPGTIDDKDIPEYDLKKFATETEEGMKDMKAKDVEFLAKPWNEGKDEKWLEEQRVAWMARPHDVDSKLARYFAETEEERRRLDGNVAMVADIEKTAEKKFGTIKDLIPKNEPDITIVGSDDNIYTYTPEEIINYNESRYKSIEIESAPGEVGRDYEVFNFEKARREMTPKEFYLFQLQGGVIPKTSENRKLLNKTEELNEKVNRKYKQVLTDIQEFTEQEIKNRLRVGQGVSYDFPATNEAEKSNIRATLTQFANLAEEQKDALPDSDTTPEIMRKVAAASNLVGSIKVVQGNEVHPAMYEINASGEFKGELVTTKFRITPEQKIKRFGRDYDLSPEDQIFRIYDIQLAKNGGNTTAPMRGETSATNSYLSSIDFPAVKIYGVRGNIEQDAGKYFIRLSVYDPEKKKWLNDLVLEDEPLLKHQVVPFIRNLTDSSIYELLKEKKPTVQNLENVKNASKKPL